MAGPSFSKRPKLTLKDHFVVLCTLLGVVYLIESGYPKDGWLFPAAFAAYAALFLALELRSRKGRVYQNGVAHIPKTEDKGIVTENPPKLSKTYAKPIDFEGYIAHRNNRNLFVSGRAGSGKSTLMRYMIGEFPDSAKTIFSFKAGDEYLKLGVPILRVGDHSGDPFADREAFVQAFLVTYPMNSQGVVAASVPNLLRKAVKESGSWKALRGTIEKAMEKEKPGNITHSAYSFILQKLTDLELASEPCALDLNKDVVLDLSGLNEAAKSFYAELYLRQAWRAIEASSPDPMRHIVIIDEAHRLLKSEATIFGEVARLIRSRGALWCGTQNYSDLPDEVRNQFAMHLLFSTKSENDLKALKEINPLLPFVATELKDHHFTDAAARELHEAIPIYTADIRGFHDYEETYLQPVPQAATAAETPKPKEMLDYREKLLSMLAQEASWPSKLAKDIAKADGMGGTEPKFAVSKALKALQKDGLIGRQMLKLGDREVVLYYRRDPTLSGLHKFMEREVTKKLDTQGIPYTLAKPGEDAPDIMTKEFDVEIETGLKHDIKELERKLANATKKTYVLVSDKADGEKYQKIISNALVAVFLFDAFFNLESQW
jgi:hypothetical protein